MLSEKCTCNFWVHVCGYFWVQGMRLLGACMRKRLGACMRLLGACMRKRLGAKYAFVGCKYAETFGCMYAVVGCKVCGDVWVHVCGCWVQVS